jgi:Fe-S-cluster containining protein
LTTPEPSVAVLEAKFTDVRKIQIDGLVEMQLPVTEEGKALIWKCRPNCGRCCFPRALSVLPRQLEPLVKQGAVEKPVHWLMMQQIQVEPFQRCPFLQEDLKCRVYADRPHSCRLYPFQYDEDRHLGYLANSPRMCPGFYLADDVDAETMDVWREVAREASEGMDVLIGNAIRELKAINERSAPKRQP